MSLLSTSEGGREEQRRKLAEGGKMPARAQRIRSGQGDRYSSAVCLLAQISGSKLAAKPEGITAQTHLQHYTARGLASQSGGGGSRKGEMEGGAGENKYAVIILKSSTLDIHCKYMCTPFPAPSSLAASIRRGSPAARSGQQQSGLPPPAGRPCRVHSHHRLGLGRDPKKDSACDARRPRRSPTTRWQATGPTRPPRRRPVTALSRSQQVPDGWARLRRARTMKCSRSHECCDRRQMSWQRPAVYTRQHLPPQMRTRTRTHAHAQPRAQTSTCTHRRADIAVGQEVISYSAGPHSSCNQTCCVLCVAYCLQLQKRTKITFLHRIWQLKGGKGSILLCTYFCLFVFVTIDTNSFSFSRTLMISVKGL